MVHEGFVGVGKRYLLFIWKVNRKVESYAIAQAYLIQGGTVFPLIIDNKQMTYSGMPWTAFEAKVKHAIAKNEATN